MPGEDVQSVGLLEIAIFLAELLLLAALAVAGARLGNSTAEDIAFAILLPVVAAGAWGRWLAPRASHRLANPARLTAKLVLVAATSALLSWSGLVWWSSAFLLISAALYAAGELRGAPHDRGPTPFVG